VAEFSLKKAADSSRNRSFGSGSRLAPDILFVNSKSLDFPGKRKIGAKGEAVKHNRNMSLGIHHSLVKECAERARTSTERFHTYEVRILDNLTNPGVSRS
jgi:hypothetical protein